MSIFRDSLAQFFTRFFTRASLCGGALLVTGAASAASPVALSLPQSAAFSFLGHSCGGIQEHAYAAGFDTATGYPYGNVYLSTRCGGSGRGGGYRTTTYSAWVAVMWDFGGNVLAATKLTSAPVVNSALNVTDAHGDELYNTSTGAFLAVPAPASPVISAATQVGDQAQVSWVVSGANPAAITSSTITATPVASVAPVVVSTIAGSAESGLVGPLQPQTTYEITVSNSTIGGAGAASQSTTLTTQAASTAPSAPTGVSARWGAQGATTAQALVSWTAAVPGDSPIDLYEVTITGSDGAGSLTQDVPGTTLNTSFTVDFIPDWSVKVRAHNSVGWGPWSRTVTLGGL